MIAVFLLFYFSRIEAQKLSPKPKNFLPDIIGDTLMQTQTTQTKLYSRELMKQWIGIWKAEIAKDTTFPIVLKKDGKLVAEIHL